MMRHPLLLNDVMFKVVFGSEQAETVLRHLLNALLGYTGRSRITSVEILNPTVRKDHHMDRGIVLDVRAQDGQGRQYNVEVQVSEDADYVNRSVYYLTRLHAAQLQRGDEYTGLCRTIGISILDYVLFPDIADLHSIYRLYDHEHQRELSDIIEIHYIELAKFRQDTPEKLRTPFERWLYLLKFGELYEGSRDVLPESLQAEEGIAMAVDRMRRARAGDEVRELIEARLKFEHDEASRLGRARREGQQEERREMARRMLERGMDRESVLAVTGLQPDELP
ncbi:MAG: Rpn family recombination-promoting nuclease/putative transposase [Candidatus Xenobia bacterium]